MNSIGTKDWVASSENYRTSVQVPSLWSTTMTQGPIDLKLEVEIYVDVDLLAKNLLFKVVSNLLLDKITAIGMTWRPQYQPTQREVLQLKRLECQQEIQHLRQQGQQVQQVQQGQQLHLQITGSPTGTDPREAQILLTVITWILRDKFEF